MSAKGVDIHIIGDKDLIKRLEFLTPSIRKKVLRPAVTAASRPIRQAAKASVPVRFGALKKSIDLKAKSYKETAVAIVGPKTGQSATGVNLFGQSGRIVPTQYAHLVEKGTKPHVIRTGRGRKVIWMHPGSPPTRFMQKALSSQATHASGILNRKIAEGIEKYA